MREEALCAGPASWLPQHVEDGPAVDVAVTCAPLLTRQVMKVREAGTCLPM